EHPETERLAFLRNDAFEQHESLNALIAETLRVLDLGLEDQLGRFYLTAHPNSLGTWLGGRRLGAARSFSRDYDHLADLTQRQHNAQLRGGLRSVKHDYSLRVKREAWLRDLHLIAALGKALESKPALLVSSRGYLDLRRLRHHRGRRLLHLPTQRQARRLLRHSRPHRRHLQSARRA